MKGWELNQASFHTLTQTHTYTGSWEREGGTEADKKRSKGWRMRDEGRKERGREHPFTPKCLSLSGWQKYGLSITKQGEKMCVCVREKDVQSANGAGVQNRLLITCVSTHRAMCVRDSCSDSNRMQKMRLIIDWHRCPCSCICVCMCRYGFCESDFKMWCKFVSVWVIRILNLTRWGEKGCTSMQMCLLFSPFLCSCMLRLHLQAFMCESTCSGACCQFGFMEGIIDFHLVYETTWVLQAVRGLLRCVLGNHSLYHYYGRP